MKFSGMIIKYVSTKRIISILHNKFIHNYKLNNSLAKQFSRFFNANVFIDFELEEEQVSKINKLFLNEQNIFYDEYLIKKGLANFLNNDENRLFLDLELAMHPYHKTKNFVQEIIQVGYYLVDNNGKLIIKDSFYVKPEIFKVLTERTIKFLKIDENLVYQGKTYLEFYNVLKNLLETHQPKIYVWGRNDFLNLDAFYQMHNLTPLTSRKEFVNLLQLYKTYHGLKNDIGLYNCYRTYAELEEEQIHDAYLDAYLTSEIFKYFKEEVKNEF